MKAYKKLMLFILAISMNISLMGCNPTSYQNSIFDNDNEIVKDSNSYTYLEKKGGVKDNTIDIEFNSFSGMDNICNIIVNEETEVMFNIKSEIDKGEFKVVIITPDDEIINILDSNNNEDKTITLKEGTNRIKFVGKKAKGKVKIDIEEKAEIEIEDLEH